MLRKGDPQATITIIGNEPHPLYNRVALPRVLKLRTPPERIIIRDGEFHRENRLDLLLETTVTHVDTKAQVVSTDRSQEIPYDALLVASGGRPNPLTVPGAAGTQSIYNFQSLDDTTALMARMHEVQQVVAVGGSYIAYEIAEAARARGLDVTWLIRGPRFLRRILDEEGGSLADRIARDAGVDVRYGEEVAEVHAQQDSVHAVTTTGGERIACELLGVGVGLTLNTEFLRDTAVETRYGIVTNEYMETTVPAVYGAGDVAEFYDVAIGRHHTMGTWNNAAAHGRVCAANMLGERRIYTEVPYYTSTLFDSTMAVVGTTPEDRPDLESLTRTDLPARLYRRLFFFEDRLVGAVLIGDIRTRRHLMNFIKSREAVSPSDREKLIMSS